METPALLTATGVFVCFEGGEGGGKSTQARLLHDWLVEEGYAAVLTRQPGGTEVGQRVREIVLSPETGELAHRTEALLYAADKAEHVETVVRPALDRGAVVITDRYVDSAIAYQGSGRDLVAAEVTAVNRWATSGLIPHLTVVLDLEPEQGLGRFAERDRIESESAEFHQRVRQAFLDLAAADPPHYLVLDARGTREDVATAVRDAVRPLLERAVRREATEGAQP
ncbi:dTMP kinase [Nocardioides daejeonensis]|uniref:dTMP kinase n=1 Tax=Nocardioides daejeonensis TaxID=1046556 RepID=UPI000D74B6E2